jgi:hypothetical protein
MVDAQPRDDGREVRPSGADVGVFVLTRPEPRIPHDIALRTVPGDCVPGSLAKLHAAI